ncbi:MAG: N-acetylglucosamine-6-phosphate deacetylase, partial [Planctomycetaceae bacterium]
MGMETDKGYFDLQVNGYMGVDFNGDGLSAAQLHQACSDMRSHGVDGFLATITTDSPDKMAGRLAKIAAMRASDTLVARTLVGFHIEGPFINETPGYRGCHPVAAIEPASPDKMNRLLDAAAGLTRMVTLAP